MSDFKKAARTDHKLRSAVFGPAGSGKTRFALELAKALCPEGKRVAFIDTEGGRAREYADLFDFDEAQLEKFSVQDYLAMMTDAYKSGLYGVLVIDSLSSFWDGPGGILAQKDQAGGKFDAWARLNPQIKRLMDAIVRYPTHTICTMRTRTEWVEQVDDRGKRSFVSAGKGPAFKDGAIYEFSFFASLDQDHTIRVFKSPPGSELDGYSGDSVTGDVIQRLKEWCNG